MSDSGVIAEELLERLLPDLEANYACQLEPNRLRLRGRTRTYYLRFRKPTLYPDELRGARAEGDNTIRSLKKVYTCLYLFR